MRNAVLPTFSSQLCNFGNNEIQMPNLEVPLHNDSKASFIDSRVYNNHNQQRGGGFTSPSELLIEYQPGPPAVMIKGLNYACSGAGCQAIMSSYNNISQQSMLHGQSSSVIPPLESVSQAAQNVRKRPVEVDGVLPKQGDLRMEKKRKITSHEEQRHHLANTEKPMLQVPVRRSQKFSDKITALQKLVSPYGKTDTASVLQEAYICIKLLQEQIQISVRSSSTIQPLHPQKIGENQLDLQSRGLCLVPVSVTRKLTQEERVDHHAATRIVMHGNF